MPSSHLVSPIINPPFLESLIEMYRPILAASGPVDTIYLPSSIGKMTLSEDVIPPVAQAGSALRAYCHGDIAVSKPRPASLGVFAVAADAKEQFN